MRQTYALFLLLLLCSSSVSAKASSSNSCQGTFPKDLLKACETVKEAKELPVDFDFSNIDPWTEHNVNALKVLVDSGSESLSLDGEEPADILLERLVHQGSTPARLYALWGLAERSSSSFDQYAKTLLREKGKVSRMGGEKGCGMVQMPIKDIVIELQKQVGGK